jgi:small subunit ribosomal protein S20
VKRALRNRAVRSEVKTLVVKARRSMSVAGVPASDRAELALDAVRALDRAAAKGVLHANNAGRRKARLMRQAAKLAVAPPAPVGKGGKKAAAAAPPAKPAPAKKK